MIVIDADRQDIDAIIDVIIDARAFAFFKL